MKEQVRRVVSSGPESTLEVAEALARRLRGGEVLALIGELGSGKTVFVKGVARGLGIDPLRVRSPTFVLHQVYSGRLELHHLDLYRLGSEAEFEALGLGDYLRPEAVVCLEWGDRFSDVLPEDRLEVELEVTEPDERRLVFRGTGESHRRLLEF